MTAFCCGAVSRSVMAAAPPVTITAPTNGTVLTAPATFTLRASVSGGGNNVSQIEFFEGTNLLGTDISNPYRVDINALAAGNYNLMAILTDDLGDKSTNSINLIVNELPSLSITNPPDGTGLIAPASFSLQADAVDTDGTVVRVQFFRGTTSIGVATTAPFTVPVQNLGVGEHTFEAVATDNLGGITRRSIDVIVKQRPMVAFTAPAAGARLTAVTNTISGTASDSVGVAAVELSVNGGTFTMATGSNSWNLPLVLPAGTNVLRARAIDPFGHYSATNTRTVFQVVTSLLTLTVEGSGTVSGAANGQGLEVGRGYQLTATPATGHVFSNWTGQALSTSPTLRFIMQSNTALQANFVPNPYLRVSGIFNGLFFETNAVRQESSGDLKLRVSASGRYSAALRLAGRRYSASGQLDLAGRATNTIVRSGLNSLTVGWAVNLQGTDQINGTVSDGVWTAELEGDRAIFNAKTNAAPLAGRYTFVLPGNGAPGTPDADGWGTLTVSASGVGTASGSLADGTRFTRKMPLSKNGAWPLYAPLYLSQGMVIGWIQFDTNAPADDLSGLVDWIKPSLSVAGFYPAGFTNQLTLTGSRYLVPVGSTNRAIALTNGAVLLNGGNLSQSWTNDVVLGTNHRVTNAGPHKLSVTLSPATGLFKGTFLDTNVARTVSFSGALLQKSTNGAGYFLGTNLSGRVLFEKRP